MPRGFLLHSRPYKESSVVATFLTDTDGRVDLIARSVRGKTGKKHGPLLPFCLYELSWVGKSELKNVQFFEVVESAISLVGTGLFCGLYINELLYYLLPKFEPEPRLMQLYSSTIPLLSAEDTLEPSLRNFEITLLESLGYGIDFFRDTDGNVVKPDDYYRLMPEQGLVRSGSISESMVGMGEAFLAMGNRDFSSSEVRRLAKVSLRNVLAIYLGGRSLRSRELFR